MSVDHSRSLLPESSATCRQIGNCAQRIGTELLSDIDQLQKRVQPSDLRGVTLVQHLLTNVNQLMSRVAGEHSTGECGGGLDRDEQ